MKVSDIMTPGAETIAPDASLRDAAQTMKRLDVGSLPVCDGDRLVGIVTDRDIVVRAVADGADAGATTVRDAMTEGIVYCQVDTDVQTVADTMKQRQIRRLVVLDADKRLAGIVSLGDLAIQGGDDARSGKVLERISEAPPSPQQ